MNKHCRLWQKTRALEAIAHGINEAQSPVMADAVSVTYLWFAGCFPSDMTLWPWLLVPCTE